jgi:hypothetical protein
MNTLEIKINDEDSKILAEVLEINISELSGEISDTDKFEFRENLKSKRMILQRILAEIKKQQSSG